MAHDTMNYPLPRTRQTAGFTLIELMITVSIIGVLAALASYGWRKSIISANEADVAKVMSTIAAQQEAYRTNKGRYASSTAWSPSSVPSGARKPMSASDDPVWGQLGVTPPAQTFFTYFVQAGTPASTGGIVAGCDKPTAPSSASFASVTMCQGITAGSYWWQIVAVGDQDGDGTYSYFVQTSATNGNVVKVNSGE